MNDEKTCEKDCPFYKGPGECDDGGTVILGPGQQFGCLLYQSNKSYLKNEKE